MVDFKEIEDNGEIWELFARDLLQELGFYIESAPDRGPDAGKDLLVSEELKGTLGKYRFQWLVSCKHFARSGKSVQERDEQNIIERIKGFNCEGFIGFYSTISAAGLNSRLKQLKVNQTIKDYRIFDYKLIENYLIRIGFSEILMRYFPESYTKVKPLHLIVDEYVPLNCTCCGRDILKAMYETSYCANIAFVTKYADSNSEKIYVEDIYWACKGKCDSELQSQYFTNRGLLTGWNDIGDLVIPSVYLKWLMAIINNLKEGRYIYKKESFQKVKHFMIALSQKVFREMTAEERKRAVKLIKLESLMV